MCQMIGRRQGPFTSALQVAPNCGRLCWNLELIWHGVFNAGFNLKGLLHNWREEDTGNQ